MMGFRGGEEQVIAEGGGGEKKYFTVRIKWGEEEDRPKVIKKNLQGVGR